MFFDVNLTFSKYIFFNFDLIKLRNSEFNLDSLFSIFPSTKISFLFFLIFRLSEKKSISLLVNFIFSKLNLSFLTITLKLIFSKF